MKHIVILFSLVLATTFFVNAQKVEHLDAKSFREKVYDYEQYKKWTYKGKQPAIVDFYASWCGPCKYIAPILEELAEEYDGKLKIYKVNTSKNRDLSAQFKIRSIPALFFITADGKIKKRVGAMSKEGFEYVINNYLKVEK